MKRRVSNAAAAVLPLAPPVPVTAAPVLSAADRENPAKLSGESLKALAHSRGIPRSECDRSNDEHLRRQMQSINYRRFDDESGD